MLDTKAKLDASEIKPLIGTVIRSDKETLLSGEHAGEIRRLFEERSVLVFPEIGFDDDEQLAFTKTLGKVGVEDYGAKVASATGADSIFRVSLDPKVTIAAGGLLTSFYWHLDGSMSAVPIMGSLLMPRVLSPTGGETEFCNTYAAYDALSEEDKQAIDDLRVVHSNVARDRYAFPEPSYERLLAQKRGPMREQPLVWKRRSGRRSMVLGGTASHIVGMDPLESWELLTRLRDWATQPQFHYRHEWTMGDLVMWDNTGTLHRAMPYDHECGRLMHRTMLEGEEPFDPA